MQRYPEYEYCVNRTKINLKEMWIFVSDNGSGWEKDILDWTSDKQYAGPIELIKRIEEKEEWILKNVGELQYTFEEDPNHIIFQMDDLFGLVLIVSIDMNSDNAIDFINKYMTESRLPGDQIII